MGNQIIGNLSFFGVDAVEFKRYREAALEAYLDGLREVGWSADAKSVGLAAACQALTYLVFVPAEVEHIVKHSHLSERTARFAKNNGYGDTEAIERWGAAVTLTVEMIEWAFREVGLIS